MTKIYSTVTCTYPTELCPGDRILMTITRVVPSESGIRGYVHFKESEERIFLNEFSGPFTVEREVTPPVLPAGTLYISWANGTQTATFEDTPNARVMLEQWIIDKFQLSDISGVILTS
jgi:hypothetical protein